MTITHVVKEIAEFNKNGAPILKKGLAITPVKFGISFTATFLDSLVRSSISTPMASIHLNHGTEMELA
ncbi:hypothetical protein O9992_21595 [Vibrio lentus]|nr:hypothetical protein [Vibrio lentus]